uniref:Uncharacterized protein n=1 Tax=Chromera velia CCMP2878 TaxID=1169474 RepID=A0A0G4I8A8_9ALVE|eukprot:Cvel_1971.t1-p1 / transcript=Cvel_1971.t1 / gene=Cvel_1971 / organism=Chromera_velia_CCMP2878 / gene_product=hypothetical protein / transcript_product=hypothetical protein / location=Cvel_scaffold75:20969-21277(-) / protein_length=103 / sequence_SO=supercontig / SO=protein_coding / is_pseudo=false
MELFDDPAIAGYNKRSAQDIPHWSTLPVSYGDATDKAIKQEIRVAALIMARYLKDVTPDFFFTETPQIAAHLRGGRKGGKRCSLYEKTDSFEEKVRKVCEKMD